MPVLRTNQQIEPLGPASTSVLLWKQPFDELAVTALAGGGARIRFTGNQTKRIDGPQSTLLDPLAQLVISAQVATTLVDGALIAAVFYDVSGNQLGPAHFSDGMLPGSWSTQTIYAAPLAGAASVQVRAQGFAGAAPTYGDTLDVRQVLVQVLPVGIELQAVATTYFDGDTVPAGTNHYRWTGTPRLSSSQEFTQDPATASITTTLEAFDQQTITILTATSQLVETGGSIVLDVVRVQDSVPVVSIPGVVSWAGSDHPSPGSWTYRATFTYTAPGGAVTTSTATSTPAVVVPAPVWTAKLDTSVDEHQVVTLTASTTANPSAVGTLTLVVVRDAPSATIGGTSGHLDWTGTDDPYLELPPAVSDDPGAAGDDPPLPDTGTFTWTVTYTFTPQDSTTPIVWSAKSAPVTLKAKPKHVDAFWDPDRGAVRFEAWSMSSKDTVFLRIPGSKVREIRGYETTTWPSGRLPGGRDGVGWDYEMPLGVTLAYVIAPVGSSTYDSATMGPTAGLVTTPGNEAWLRDPANPTLGHKVTVVSTGDEARPARQTVYDITGRRNGYVVHDVRHSRQGTFQLLVPQDYPTLGWIVTEREDMERDLFDTGRVLLLNMCYRKNFKALWLAPTDVVWTRVNLSAAYTVDVSYIEVDNPTGLDISIPPELTWQQAKSFPAAGATWSSWLANGSWLDLFAAHVKDQVVVP